MILLRRYFSDSINTFQALRLQHDVSMAESISALKVTHAAELEAERVIGISALNAARAMEAKCGEERRQRSYELSQWITALEGMTRDRDEAQAKTAEMKKKMEEKE